MREPVRIRTLRFEEVELEGEAGAEGEEELWHLRESNQIAWSRLIDIIRNMSEGVPSKIQIEIHCDFLSCFHRFYIDFYIDFLLVL
jgi:hypothetical protein